MYLRGQNLNYGAEFELMIIVEYVQQCVTSPFFDILQLKSKMTFRLCNGLIANHKEKSTKSQRCFKNSGKSEKREMQ
uniref:Uncharacterized protein n=1 Tax=Romanomermis culicivorax TaxID=13658 RepID=A0A915L6R0_ROMCU